MKTIKAYRKRSSEAAASVLADGMATVTKMDEALTKHFPYELSTAGLEEMETKFKSEMESNGPDSPNALLSASLPAVRSLISLASSHLQTLESYIALNHPRMEDGNNFGVTVQMTVAKFLRETREGWGKISERIPAYHKERAEAVEKLGLAATSESETRTEAESKSTGGKDGDTATTESKTVKESKTSKGGEVDAHRLGYVLAMDVQCYLEMRAGLTAVMDGYVTVLDNVEKNREKIDSPKGSGGPGGMGMY